MLLIIILFIINILGLTFVFIFHKDLLDFTSYFCKNVRDFIANNGSIFTILFLSIFFIEQLVLVIGVYFYDASLKLQMLIGIFALIVITTATLQKFIWQYKYHKRSEELVEVSNMNDLLYGDIEDLIDENTNLRKQLKEK